MDPLRIGICGNGTVGGGVIQILADSPALLTQRAGRPLTLTRLGARRDRDDCPPTDVPVHRDLLEVARADDVDVLVETIGGTDFARELVETALTHGKSVVTANKALIAEQGNELLALAEEQGVSLLFEAGVAGGIPILKALRDGMAANRVDSVSGIINGTGNFILTEMGSGKRPFDEVLAEAQALGYAEVDPTFDVEGIDAAHKLAILAAMAFGTTLNFPAVHCEGIASVTSADIECADELGYRIKHLGIAKRHDRGVELRVHPTLLPKSSLLANVDGVLNAVRLEGDAAGPTVYSGAGAGRLPTASAVVADLVDLARSGATTIAGPGATTIAGPGATAIAGLGAPTSALTDAPVVPMDDVACEWYLRLEAEGRPGVMSDIANRLGAQGISIETLVQRPLKQGDSTVPVVVLTNEAREESLVAAVDALAELEVVRGRPHCIRIESAD